PPSFHRAPLDRRPAEPQRGVAEVVGVEAACVALTHRRQAGVEQGLEQIYIEAVPAARHGRVLGETPRGVGYPPQAFDHGLDRIRGVRAPGSRTRDRGGWHRATSLVTERCRVSPDSQALRGA